MAMLGLSIALALSVSSSANFYSEDCKALASQVPASFLTESQCKAGLTKYLWQSAGEFGGFTSSIVLASLPQDSLVSEVVTFFISNGTQLLYSVIYLLLVYNVSLISMEHDWGKFDQIRSRVRATIVKGDAFRQSYFLQLPRNILVPVMIFSATMHWLLGQALSARENIYTAQNGSRPHSQYDATFATVPFWIATVGMMTMTGVCWWAFTYKRKGFIPQMYGSMRVLCASTTGLHDFGYEGLMWGELIGKSRAGGRIAGFSNGPVNPVQPNKFYPGVSHED